MKNLSTFLLLTLALILSGCASIVSKSDYPISIRSTPADAELTITNIRTGAVVHQGRTPVTLTLSASDGYFRSASYRVEFERDGYYQTSRTIESRIDGWYIGNIVFGGLIGFLVVDPITGAMFRLSPRDLDVTLAARSEGSAEGNQIPILRFLTLDEITEENRSSLIPL